MKKQDLGGDIFAFPKTCIAKNTFELFGLDFMIDSLGKLWLIEVNTNPCL